MPSKYTDQRKSEALQMLALNDHISHVHFATGIPERTLRDWRKALRDQSNRQTAEKTFPLAASCQKDQDNADHNTPVPENTDIEDFTYIRQQLMKYARQMASDLRPDEPDSNRRTLALARILDRIQWLDQILPNRIPEQTIRWEFLYDGEVHDRPPWEGSSDDES